MQHYSIIRQKSKFILQLKQQAESWDHIKRRLLKLRKSTEELQVLRDIWNNVPNRYLILDRYFIDNINNSARKTQCKLKSAKQV